MIWHALCAIPFETHFPKGMFMNLSPAFKPAVACESDHHASASSELAERLARLIALREHAPHDRGAIEAFIRDCFASAHGASVNHFMPRLLSLESRSGERIAAFGLRDAGRHSLFLEQYLDMPIESVLQSRLGRAVRRDEIIEVGNLSALYPGAARWLIVALTAVLHREGYRWVVFTGTAALRNGFTRLGLRPVEIGEASLARLPAVDRDGWGRYYDHAPLVMAGDIAQGYRELLMQGDLARMLRAGMDTVEAA